MTRKSSIYHFNSQRMIDQSVTFIQKKSENGTVAAIKITDIMVNKSAHNDGSS